MTNDREIGRAAWQRGYVAPPQTDNYVSRQLRDAGWYLARNEPKPQPQPKDTNRR